MARIVTLLALSINLKESEVYSTGKEAPASPVHKGRIITQSGDLADA